jgi:hypothetical protein
VVDGQLSTLSLCRSSRQRVERGGGKHFRSGKGNVHGHQGSAVGFVEVQALDLVIIIYADFVALESCISKLFHEMGGGMGGDKVPRMFQKHCSACRLRSCRHRGQSTVDGHRL